jgi:hypothetical protein
MYCGAYNTLKTSKFRFRVLRKLVSNLPTINTSVNSAALVVFLLGQLGLRFVPRLKRFVCKGDLALRVLVNVS